MLLLFPHLQPLLQPFTVLSQLPPGLLLVVAHVLDLLLQVLESSLVFSLGLSQAFLYQLSGCCLCRVCVCPVYIYIVLYVCFIYCMFYICVRVCVYLLRELFLGGINTWYTYLSKYGYTSQKSQNAYVYTMCKQGVYIYIYVYV